jgi:hypothetical protein
MLLSLIICPTTASWSSLLPRLCRQTTASLVQVCKDPSLSLVPTSSSTALICMHKIDISVSPPQHLPPSSSFSSTLSLITPVSLVSITYPKSFATTFLICKHETRWLSPVAHASVVELAHYHLLSIVSVAKRTSTPTFLICKRGTAASHHPCQHRQTCPLPPRLQA